MRLYRGTQRPEIKGRFKAQSWTPSKEVAVIYSARPGDAWGSIPPMFLEGSTVHIGDISDNAKILFLCGLQCSLKEVLEKLQYEQGDGMTLAEALRILNYMNNRITGRAKGGEFKYKIYDEDGEEEEEVLSFRYTKVAMFKEEFDWEGIEVAHRLVADSFIYADAPSVREVAFRLGYVAIAYTDAFAGGESAAEKLLGCELSEVEGVEFEDDFDFEEIPVHETFRPLQDGVIVLIESVPIKEILGQVSCNEELKRKLLR